MRNPAMIWPVTSNPAQSCDRADSLRDRIDARLAVLAETYHPEALGNAMRHLLLAPAKRARGIMLLLALEGQGQEPGIGLDTACAIEMLHAASLIVDDLPCMDNAKIRRGCTATHLSYGEDRAILAAVALIAESMRVAAEDERVPAAARARIVALLARALGPAGLSGGQELDLYRLPNANRVDEVEAVHARKTGVLFALAFESAAVLAGASAPVCERYNKAGMAIGLGFQCFDDLLDVYGRGAEIGKDTGRDQGKATLARLLGRAAAIAHAKARIAEGVALLGRSDAARGGGHDDPAIAYVSDLTSLLVARMVTEKTAASG
ncbi:MAG: polyprenyl synthetase family protein [Hyphomicrobiaceae bacterium]|nr:polyprenyl synthetase family protein [Hyphomicrobiaceae bacterium]